MATTYHLHQLVWVKQEGYPWWPGIVYDPSQLDDHTNTHDEDGKLCILCLPTSASTVLFVDDAQDVEIIRPFRGPSVDDALVAEGLASDDGEEGSCAAAVREALTLFAKQDADSVAAGSSSIHVDEPHPSTLKDAAMERKRPRRSDDDGSDHEEDDLLLLDANSDELPQKKKKASDDVGRQRTMDEFFEEEAKKEPPQFFADNDRDYYTKQTKGKKATDAQLVELREHITAAIAHCLSHGSYEEKQDELLGYLRQLANVVVSLDQLTSIQIGVVVGQLLKRSFPARINQLAQAVLECWYSQLPDAVRQSVVTNSELDRCSNDTNAEARSDRVDASLGAVGVHLFESFTDEEIFSAPLGVDLVQLCKEIEVLLMEKANNDADLRIMLLSSMADAACAPVRQALIDGIISTEDIVDNARDLLALVRPRGNKTRHGLRLSSTNLQSPVRDGSVGSQTVPPRRSFPPRRAATPPSPRSILAPVVGRVRRTAVCTLCRHTIASPRCSAVGSATQRGI